MQDDRPLRTQSQHRDLASQGTSTDARGADTGSADAPPRGKSDERKKRQPGATESLPKVSLPKSGGAIRGIGEKFTVNAATGTAAMELPLPVSAARSGFTPALSLSYDSGSGNGPFGFGWSLGLPAITRKTDKGLPQYLDDEESDVFILTGSEDLVPIVDESGNRVQHTRTVYGTQYEISLYRPRIEGLFARIERWVATDSQVSHWRSISRDNVTTLYGVDPLSRVADPDDPTRVFSYRICRTWDDKGNVTAYEYIAEDGAGIDVTQAHEANRSMASRAVQTYLQTIRYGNIQPYLPDWSAETELALPTDWMFSIVMDYGQPWPVRPDPFSSYRGAFELRTYRRVQRVLFYNNFPLEATVGANRLVRSLDFVYSDQQTPTDPHNPLYTFLVSVTQTGYNTTGTSRSLPPLEFAYSEPVIQQDVLTLDPGSVANLPEGLDGERFRWVDLDGEGLCGILSDAGGGWYYKRNLSANNRVAQLDGTLATRAAFAPVETVAGLPSNSNLSGAQQLLDLSGSGRLDVVALGGSDPGFFERTEDESFEPLQTFQALPQLDWTDPNIKFIDLTGDGLADVLFTEDGLFTFYSSLGGDAGFAEPEQVRTPWDEEKGPKVVLSDGTETIFLADMSGDGLHDIVRVRNGETCYWPNIGYGRFGAKVTMDAAPRFDNEERFDPRRIRLADIDGTGSSDLLYVGGDGVRAWFNQSGNAWSAPTTIGVFPSADKLSAVQAIDLLGTGTACLVWSSPLPAERGTPLLYVDLMSGQKPHLMTLARNNLGAETRVTYAPSTQFYLADREAGVPWVTHLPFPVQVVERVETIDWIGRNRLVSRYAYHHGYFDGYEREFRGFGMVERWDTEEFRTDTKFDDGDFVNWDAQSWSPPQRTRTWFHTGAFLNAIPLEQQYATEYWIEPALRPPSRAADAAAMQLPDIVLPAVALDSYEIQEAYRALKGRALRIETYADDDSANAGNPYTVEEKNYTLSCLQHRDGNLHAVFFVNPRESLAFNYERSGDDPRVTHEVTLAVDAYGNVTQSVAIGYPRRIGYAAPEPSLSATIQAMLAYDQARLHVVGTASQYTNPIDDLSTFPDAYRVPLPASTDVAELTGLAPSSKGTGITNLFGFDEINTYWASAWTGSNDNPYEAIPAADVDGAGALPTTLTRRVTNQRRTLYRSDDLTALLGPGQLQTRALVGQSYEAALTPGLLSGVFGSLVTTAILNEGGYVKLPSQTGWWVPTGRVFYSPGDADTPAQELANAVMHFFQPRRAVDPFGAVTRLDFDAYDLLPATATDPVGNVTTASNDYRVLQPATVTDPNGNRGALAFDALGFAAGTAVMGKPTDPVSDSLTGFVADLDDATIAAQLANPLADPATVLGDATTRVLYDIGAYYRTRTAAQPDPPVVYTLARETHVADLGPKDTPRYQYHLTYNDGFARQIQIKALTADGPVTDGGPVVSPRWAGSGWTIFNNKGDPVRRYEPFFSATPAFEFAAQTGVSTVLLYDPVARAVVTFYPDNSWGKTVISAWVKAQWDRNDTVLIGDPRADADVGAYFERLLGAALFTSWHDLRIGGAYGATPEDQAAEQDAAKKAEAHANTPAAVHYNALARGVLAVVDNGAGTRYGSRTAYDSDARPIAIFDPLDRRVQEHVLRVTGGYLAGIDMAGDSIYLNSADSGARRTLRNVSDHPIRAWDARTHAFRFVYDPAQRATHRYISTGSAPEILADRSVYGEGLASVNLCGRLFRHYDMGGLSANTAYDYAGNLIGSTRQLALDYHQTVDWTVLATLTTASALDAAAAPLLSPGDSYNASTVYDALNRPTQMVAPHSATMKPCVLRPGYDPAARIDQLDAWLQQASAPTGLLDPTTADRHVVTSVTYNARGQRLQVFLGNGTKTAYDYDPETFRLAHLTTTRSGTFPANQQVAQALAYYDDPIGNVTRIRDDADIQDVIYFTNQRVEPSADYTYDPLYRLIKATGREHLGQTGGVLGAPQQVTDDDSFRVGLPQPGDGTAMGTYVESYAYDAVGNLQSMIHQVSSGQWARRYSYLEPSQITSAETCNRLTATSLPGDPITGPYTAAYQYDAHGNMTRMPHLPAMTWDEDDRLRSTTQQVVTSGVPATTYYVSDTERQRVRKTTDAQAQQGPHGVRTSERIYLGLIELYREFAADGTTITLARETLHCATGEETAALIEMRATGSDRAPAQLVRYQCTNHLRSAVLELDDQSNIISYEEYFPFGSTSYQAVASATDLPKRYRYTGKERDDENHLYYHGARYYAPWLGRWTACDPLGLRDGLNVYAFVKNNPIRSTDPTGTQCNSAIASCTDDQASRSLEEDNLRSSENDRLVDQVNDENARFRIAAEEGKLKPQPMDGKKWEKKVDEAIKAHESPRAKLEKQIAEGEQYRQGLIAAEAKEEAEAQKELPGTVAGAVPFYGSGKSTLVHFSHGNYGRAAVFGVLTISDAFLVKAAVQGAGKLVLRGIGGELITTSIEVSAKASGRTTVVYQLVDEAGERVYVGISKDYRLTTRLTEHSEKFGLNFRGMQVISEPLYETEARMLETRLLEENMPILNTLESSIHPPVYGLYTPSTIRPAGTLLNPGAYKF